MPNRFDNFGTDYTTVDRMANPYRPGTAPHGVWMMAWVDAQDHWQTESYRKHRAEVVMAKYEMEGSCAPVANWVDEVLFEVAEARHECENVTPFHQPDPMDLGCHVRPFGGQEPVAVIFDEIIDFECTFDGPTPSRDHTTWHIQMTARVPLENIPITINIV